MQQESVLAERLIDALIGTGRVAVERKGEVVNSKSRDDGRLLTAHSPLTGAQRSYSSHGRWDGRPTGADRPDLRTAPTLLLASSTQSERRLSRTRR